MYYLHVFRYCYNADSKSKIMVAVTSLSISVCALHHTCVRGRRQNSKEMYRICLKTKLFFSFSHKSSVRLQIIMHDKNLSYLIHLKTYVPFFLSGCN